MNYSRWREQFEIVVSKLASLDSKEAKEACSAMECWAQNGCNNPEPDAEECASIYCHVMSNLDEMELGNKPFYTDVYNIEFNI